MAIGPPDDARIEACVRKYQNTVYRLAYARTHNRADADDIFQEVFLQYVRVRPSFESEEHEKAWFIRVTINRANSLWARAFRRRDEPLDDALPAPETPGRLLDDELRRLTPAYRTVLHLFYYERYTTAEIARLTGCRESTVRARLTRARAQLRGLLEGGDCLV